MLFVGIERSVAFRCFLASFVGFVVGPLTVRLSDALGGRGRRALRLLSVALGGRRGRRALRLLGIALGRRCRAALWLLHVAIVGDGCPLRLLPVGSIGTLTCVVGCRPIGPQPFVGLFAGPFVVSNHDWLVGSASCPLRIAAFGSEYIIPVLVVVDADPADNPGTLQDGQPVVVLNKVVAQIGTVEITVTDKDPMVVRVVVLSSETDVYADAGTHGCPTVIAVGDSPTDPGRAPFITGNPHPSVSVVVIPTTVMKGRPTPFVVGDPSPTVVGQGPMAVSRIRYEVVTFVRQPHSPQLGIVYPLPIRAQVVVENPEIDVVTLCLGAFRTHQREEYEQQERDRCF